jgi:hypothetical protein
MPVRSSGLALLAVAGIAVMLTACSSSGAGKADASASGVTTRGSSPSSSPVASTTATTTAAIPAGYHRVGGSVQGISLAVPKSWVSVDFAKQSIYSAVKKLGISGNAASVLEQDVQSIQTSRAIGVYDTASVTSNPNHFVRNLIAYCGSSGTTDTGSAGIPSLKQVMKTAIATVASHITQNDVTIGGVPGIETSYKVNASEGVQGSQLEVLPKPDVVCYVSLTFFSPQTPGNYLAVAAATAQFP